LSVFVVLIPEHLKPLVELHLQRVGSGTFAGISSFVALFLRSASLLIWINRQHLSFTTQSVVMILIYSPLPLKKLMVSALLFYPAFLTISSRFPFGAAS
jgi:hypothetical protein